LAPAVEDCRAAGDGFVAGVDACGHVDAIALAGGPELFHGGGVAGAEGAVELGVALQDA
jgi:hypothetical protein